MIRLWAVLGFLLLPLAGVAQGQLPAFYDVTGVADDDVLNIRRSASASSDIVGALAPHGTDIEVVAYSADRSWGMVNENEQSGWVSIRYLARQPGQVWPGAGELAISPKPLWCFGTEPFWSLTLSTGDEMSYTNPFEGDGNARVGVFSAVQANGTAKRAFVARLDDGPDRLTGVLTHEVCSDGMSDQLFGLAIDLVRATPDGRWLDSGCCRLVAH